MNEIPIIAVTYTSKTKRMVKFYCEFCRIDHVHGAFAGHRVAHCTNDNSPYKQTGYILQFPEAGQSK